MVKFIECGTTTGIDFLIISIKLNFLIFSFNYRTTISFIRAEILSNSVVYNRYYNAKLLLRSFNDKLVRYQISQTDFRSYDSFHGYHDKPHASITYNYIQVISL